MTLKIMQAILIGENDMKKTTTKNKNLDNGFSLIEILVVLFVFSILIVVVTQTLAISLRGSRKSESVGNTRTNVQYAVNVMDRLLRNARSLSCPTSTISKLNYVDEHGNAAYFECVTVSGKSYIASNSASQRLTSDTVTITNCSDATKPVFRCTQGAGVPDAVDIFINGTDANVSGIEGSSVPISTKILLRNY
jgi:prepilin-type N-terminal cleavage/methylation domain-containing protein